MYIEVCGTETIYRYQSLLIFNITHCGSSCVTVTDMTESYLKSLFSVNSQNCPLEQFTVSPSNNLVEIRDYSSSSAGFMRIYNNYTPGQY